MRWALQLSAQFAQEHHIGLTALAMLSNQLAAAQSAAQMATMLGGGGLLFGLISLGVAIMALRGRGGRAVAVEPSAARSSR